MKKFLCSLIAISLVLSILPAAFAETAQADPIAKTYKFNYGDIGLLATTYLDEIGDDIYNQHGWKYFDMNDTILAEKKLNVAQVQNNKQGLLFFLRQQSIKDNTPVDFALMLKAPASAGFYVPSTEVYVDRNETYAKSINWYMSKPVNGKVAVEDYIKTEYQILKSDKISYSATATATTAVYTSQEEPIISAFNAQYDNYKFFSITLDPILNPVMTTTADSVSTLSFDLADGDTTNDSQTVTLSTTVSGKDTSGVDVEPIQVSNNFITYKSSDEKVATITADGTITAVGGGTATIYAESSDKKYNSLGTGIIVTVTEPEKPGEAVTDTDKSVSVMPENPNEGTVTGLDDVVDEVSMGTAINPIATPADGYKFAYWKDSFGTVLSTNPSETFVINTNTAIIAVFDKITEESSDKKTVELYNANGMLFHKDDEVALNTSFAEVSNAAGIPSLVGYVFKHWSMYANEAKIEDTMPITALTRAVAIYEEPTAQYTVKVGGTDIVANKKYKYGEEVTVTAKNTNFSCWKLGDKIVSYKPSYTFSVWGNVDLTEATDEVTEAPVATLVKDGENHLLIYSVPENYTKIEAGIIFSNNNSITVDAFDGKKTSEVRGTGQFMVSSDFTYARGYLIFKNNTSGEIRILYAE